MKTAAQAMHYEDVAPKKVDGKRMLLKELDHLGTPSIIWFLIKRHKVGILGTWAIVITIVYLFPPAPALLLSIFN